MYFSLDSKSYNSRIPYVDIYFSLLRVRKNNQSFILCSTSPILVCVYVKIKIVQLCERVGYLLTNYFRDMTQLVVS